jgi:glycosyltransferase involved in cell wall biosynthesis
MPPETVAIYLSGRIHGSRERAFLELIRRLADSGTRVDVLVAGAETWLRSALDSRAHVEDLSRWWMGTGWFRLPHLLRIYLSVPVVAGYLRRVRPDVLFATSIPPNLASLAGRALAATSTVVMVRQSNVLRLAQVDRYAVVRRRPRDWLLPMLYRRADKVIAVSAGVADNLRALRAGHAHSITVIPNGVALGEITTKAAQPVEHPWLQTPGEPVLLAVGRLVAKKDYPTLLKAFAIVRRTFPVRLVILGEGPERRRLEALARKLEVEPYLSMPGFCANPFAYFARASAYVLSSISEGMPSSLIEALACGCPVVSTDCPSGPSEILENGRHGRLVPVGNPQALSEALIWTLQQPRSEDRLRARASELSLEASVGRYLEILAQASRCFAARRPEAALAADRHS